MASNAIGAYIASNGLSDIDALITYAFYVAQYFGTAAASLAAIMYDTVANAEGKSLPPAELADSLTYGDVAKQIYGTLKHSQNPEELKGAVSRLVKLQGQDTLLQNGIRDHAEFAWIPSGDTCPFCIMLASNGWRPISNKALKNGHAEHIHANCDCTYMIRHSKDFEVEGYDPEVYRQMYDEAEGKTPEEKINSMRRMFYAQNKGIVGPESSKAEEYLQGITDFEKSVMNNPTESGLLYKQDGTTVSFDGIEHHVVGDSSILNEMEGGIFTHNHPVDITFSDDDIVNGIVKGNLAELRAITSGGNLHQLVNEGASLDDRRKFLAQYSDRRKKYNNIAIQKIRRGENINQLQYVSQRLEEWLAENASTFHLKYIKSSV